MASPLVSTRAALTIVSSYSHHLLSSGGARTRGNTRAQQIKSRFALSSDLAGYALSSAKHVVERLVATVLEQVHLNLDGITLPPDLSCYTVIVSMRRMHGLLPL